MDSSGWVDRSAQNGVLRTMFLIGLSLLVGIHLGAAVSAHHLTTTGFGVAAQWVGSAGLLVCLSLSALLLRLGRRQRWRIRWLIAASIHLVLAGMSFLAVQQTIHEMRSSAIESGLAVIGYLVFAVLMIGDFVRAKASPPV
jgi:hypothetical protein